MDLSNLLHASHTVASPSGEHVAAIANGKLRVCSVHAPERYSEITIRVPAKDIIALRWSDDRRIAILSAHSIEVVDLEDYDYRIRLDNGSGGLGRFTSADFIGADYLLVLWEFGKVKLWDLSSGKGVEVSDIKTVCSGDRWSLRPHDSARSILATLSRPGADDILNIYLSASHKQVSSTKLPTVDAQSLAWSPDGRWLAVLDAPIASSSIHFYTPDGHLFRSYPPASDNNSSALGVKAAVWSADSQVITLTKYDGKIILLNTRTFAPLAVIEHTTTIDQRSLPPEQQAPIWEETVSASGERTYTYASQPVSPPLSRIKPSTEPSELGVAEARFSSNGSYLATRDERMLNTVWIWNMATLAAHAVLIQHSNVRKLHWHPSRPESLMLDCGEGIAYLFSASSRAAPIGLSLSAMSGSPAFSWLLASAILAASKSAFRVVYPEGRPEAYIDDEGASEDSLFDLLSGRKPMPEQSYTERIDLEVETEEDTQMGMDDTFRFQRKKERRHGPEMTMDPFDDSQIF